MVVGEIPEFFQFPKCDISTARCKCTINIFTYKGIKVVIISEFINMTVLLSMWAVFIPIVFFTWSWIQFLKEIVLVMRNCYITMSEIELVFRRAELRCSGSLYSMLLFKKMYLIQIFNQYLLNKKDDTCRPMDTNLSVLIELSL